MDKFEKILDIIDHQEKYSDEEIREILQDEECRKLYQTMMEVDSALENPSPIINVDEEWEKFSQEHQLQEEATQNAAQEAASHPITSWRKLAASIAGFVLISGIAFAAIHTYIKRSQEPTQVTADTHPEVINSDSAKLCKSQLCYFYTTMLEDIIYPTSEVLYGRFAEIKAASAGARLVGLSNRKRGEAVAQYGF